MATAVEATVAAAEPAAADNRHTAFLSIRCPPWLYEAVHLSARKAGVPVPDFIRDALVTAVRKWLVSAGAEQ